MDKGIRFIVGRPKGQVTTDVQTVLFDQSQWTLGRAKTWLKSNGFKYGAVDYPRAGSRSKYMRFRQRDPDDFQRKSMRTITPGKAMAKSNPKKRRTAAQKRATEKMIAARKKQLRHRRSATKKPTTKRRRVVKTRKNPVTPLRGKHSNYYIKTPAGYFDGVGFTKSTRDAAVWHSESKAKSVAQKLANAIKKDVTIVVEKKT